MCLAHLNNSASFEGGCVHESKLIAKLQHAFFGLSCFLSSLSFSVFSVSLRIVNI
jgi:hypothetical protein